MWDKPLKELEKVDNPTETDETEDEKKRTCIFCQFTILLILSRQNKDLGIRA